MEHGCLERGACSLWSHTQTHDKNNTTHHTKRTTPQATTERTAPLTSQRSKVARRRCVLPPTLGWVAALKSAWEVGSAVPLGLFITQFSTTSTTSSSPSSAAAAATTPPHATTTTNTNTSTTANTTTVSSSAAAAAAASTSTTTTTTSTTTTTTTITTTITTTTVVPTPKIDTAKRAVAGSGLTRGTLNQKNGEEPPATGSGRVFSFDASSDLLATRWRLWRQCDSSALRPAFVA